MGKKSLIWQYYHHMTGDEEARCKQDECKDFGAIKCSNHSTKGLVKHLEASHPKLYEEYTKKAEKAKSQQTLLKPQKPASDAGVGAGSSGTSTSQTTLGFKPKQVPQSLADEYDRLVVEMIATDFEPFRVVEREGFKRIISKMQPGYQLRSREYYKETVFPKVYNGIRGEVQREIDSAQYLSFTTDGWTDSTAGIELLGVTCHYISQDFERKNRVLSTEPVEVAPTAENLARTLEKVWKKWEIGRERIHLLLRDGASVMVKLTTILKVEDEWCLSHQLQLVVNKGLEAQPGIKNIRSKIAAMSRHFGKSVKNQHALLEKQRSIKDSPQLKFLKDVPTRWNSTYMTLGRLLKIKQSMVLYAAENLDESATLNANEWEMIEKLRNCLKPFNDFTDEISKDDTLISITLPVVYRLNNFLARNKVSGIKTARNYGKSDDYPIRSSGQQKAYRGGNIP